MRRFIRAWAISTIAVLWPICASAEAANNDEVAHKIHDVLKSSGRMSGSSFIIKCQDGIACLEGRVASEEQKTLALELTGEVPEITEVVDHLHLEPTKKPANPVVRLLTKTFQRPSGAQAPQPQVEDLVSDSAAEAPAEETVPDAGDRGSVFPESLMPAEAAPATNPIVRQAANLRTIWRRKTQPAPRTLATESADSSESGEPTEAEPRAIQHTSTRCAACDKAVIRTAAMPRTAHTVSTKNYRLAASSRQTTPSRSASSQQGRVRMVPMMEMPDGRLVPVRQARRTSPSGQQSASSSRSRPQSMARRQEVIDGPLDMDSGATMAPGPIAGGPVSGAPLPAYVPGVATGAAPAYYDQPHMPNYSWPSYAAHPNYAGLTYPRQYSPTAWPYIGPFYPYPQVPLGWRKVTLEWDDGWWFLDFDDTNRSYSY